MGNPRFITRDKCPACSSDDFSIIYSCPFTEPPIREYLEEFYSSQGQIEFSYLEGAIYSLAECDTCQLIFQKQIPNDDLIAKLYEEWIDPETALIQYRKEDTLASHAAYAQEIMQILAYFNRAPSSLKFLDFGMGWGEWALMAKAFGCDSYGLDLSEERSEYARSNGIHVLTWDDIPQHNFDFINTEQVFEHLAKPLETLLHLRKGLKENGLFKISVPQAHDIDRRLKIMDWKTPKGSRNSLNPVAPLEHINCYRRKSIIKMAKVASMEEVLIPLAHQYQYTTNWSGVKQAIKNLVRPMYRNILRKPNYVFVRKVKVHPQPSWQTDFGTPDPSFALPITRRMPVCNGL
jgi:2-polyprenyl-3-methyl-5-hydroxy-6-metoxy-1,4-benzoquinol methylase